MKNQETMTMAKRVKKKAKKKRRKNPKILLQSNPRSYRSVLQEDSG